MGPSLAPFANPEEGGGVREVGARLVSVHRSLGCCSWAHLHPLPTPALLPPQALNPKAGALWA